VSIVVEWVTGQGWGAPWGGGGATNPLSAAPGGWLPSSKLVPHRSRTRFAPPLPPPPPHALSVDNLLPDGSRDLVGIVGRARSSALTGGHMAGGLCSIRGALFNGNPENVNYYARVAAKHGVLERGESSIKGVWDQVYGTAPAAGGAAAAAAAAAGGSGGGRRAGGSPASAAVPPQLWDARQKKHVGPFQFQKSPEKGGSGSAGSSSSSSSPPYLSASPEKQWMRSLRSGGGGVWDSSLQTSQRPAPIQQKWGTTSPPGAFGAGGVGGGGASAPQATLLGGRDLGALSALRGGGAAAEPLPVAATPSGTKAGGGGPQGPPVPGMPEQASLLELESWFEDAQALQDVLSRA